MAEELENSLLQSVETFLNERLKSIEEQLDRLQNDFNEQIARVRENAARPRCSSPITKPKEISGQVNRPSAR